MYMTAKENATLTAIQSLEPLRIHTADTLSAVLRNAMLNNMKHVVRGLTVARSRRQKHFHASAIAYGASLSTWNETWMECAKVIDTWVEKLDEKGIGGCPSCTLFEVENVFRNVLTTHTLYVIHNFFEGQETFKSPSPDQGTYDALYAILDPESHEHDG